MYYFIAEIHERELTSKVLGKYIATFDYLDKTLLISSAANDSVFIVLFATVIGTPVEITSTSLGLVSFFK